MLERSLNLERLGFHQIPPQQQNRNFPMGFTWDHCKKQISCKSSKLRWRAADFAVREWWHGAEVVIHWEITRWRRRVRLPRRQALNISRLV